MYSKYSFYKKYYKKKRMYFIPNLEIEIHDSALSSHSWVLRKTIIEPSGATQVLHKPPKYEHSAYSKNPISRFGFMFPILILG